MTLALPGRLLPAALAAALATALLGIALPGAALARALPPLQLVVDECVSAPRDEIERLCAVELGAVPLPPDDLSPDATRLLLTCRDGLIELQVDDPVTGKTAQRLIDVGGLGEASGPGALPPESRARLLALALSELVTASWAELLLSPPRVPAARITTAPAVRRAAAAVARRRLPAPPAPRLRLLAAAGVQIPLGADRAPLFGGGLRLAAAHRPWLGWELDLRYLRGRDETALGTVTTDLLGAGAAAVFQWQWLRPGDARRGGRVHLGGGVRGGAVRVAGEPAPGSGALGGTIWGPTAGLYATAGAELTLGRLLLGVTADGGYVLLPVIGRAADVPVAGVEGPWLGLHLCIGVTP